MSRFLEGFADFILEHYFKQFSSESISNSNPIQDYMVSKVSDERNASLLQPFTRLDIKETFRQRHLGSVVCLLYFINNIGIL